MSSTRHGERFCGAARMKTRDRLAVTYPAIKEIHFHDSRVEALTRLARSVDVMALAKISGHKDLAILQNTHYREAPKISQRGFNVRLYPSVDDVTGMSWVLGARDGANF
ncbi:UNVERIFIED_ORG: phage integrase family protein [Burkholderia sp. CF145]